MNRTVPTGAADSTEVRSTESSTVLSQTNETTLLKASITLPAVYLELNSTSGNPFDLMEANAYDTHAQAPLDREKMIAFLEACNESGRDPAVLLKAAVERCCEEVLTA